MARRCFWPPDRVAVDTSANSHMPTLSRALRTLAMTSVLLRRWVPVPSATSAAAVGMTTWLSGF